MITAPGSYYLYHSSVYRGGQFVDRQLGPDLEYVGTGDLDRPYGDQRPDLVMPSYLTYGDYSGGSVEQSNNQAFREQFAELQGVEWWNLAGMIGIDGGLVIRADADERHEEIRDFFLALDDYPLADEDLHSQVQMENEQQQWDDYARRDFKEELLKIIDDEEETLRDLLDSEDEEQEVLRSTWHMLAEITSAYPEEESGGGFYWRFDDLLRPVRHFVDTLNDANPEMVDAAVWLLLLSKNYNSKAYNGGISRLWRAINYADEAVLRVASDMAHEKGDPEAGFDFLVTTSRAPWEKP